MILSSLMFTIVSDAISQKKISNSIVLKLGDQVWMTENLDVNKLQNGDTIFQARSMREWRQALDNKLAAWCYPEFDDANRDLGRLYNFYAVFDPRGLAPIGWSIPTDYDWEVLANFLGDEITGGQKLNEISMFKKNKLMKIKGSFFNKSPGSCNLDGFWGTGESNSWWSSTNYFGESNWCRSISKSGPIYRNASGTWGIGMPVRCILSSTSSDGDLDLTKRFPILDSPYHPISIGHQVWSDRNLSEKVFRNGDTILFVRNPEEWKKANLHKIPAWAYLENRSINGKNYGYLYNWYAVNDKRGLAPEGWEIASLQDWQQLIENSGGKSEAGCILKSDQAGFNSSQNKGKLNILLGGGMNLYGVVHFGDRFSNGFWTSSESSKYESFCIYFDDSCEVKNWATEKSHGYYVRCIKK